MEKGNPFNKFTFLICLKVSKSNQLGGAVSIIVLLSQFNALCLLLFPFLLFFRLVCFSLRLLTQLLRVGVFTSDPHLCHMSEKQRGNAACVLA